MLYCRKGSHGATAKKQTQKRRQGKLYCIWCINIWIPGPKRKISSILTGDTLSETGGSARLPSQVAGPWGHINWSSVRWGKKYFVLGWPEQPRQDKSFLYRHDELNEPTNKGPLSFVLFESPFTSVSTISRGHPSLQWSLWFNTETGISTFCNLINEKKAYKKAQETNKFFDICASELNLDAWFFVKNGQNRCSLYSPNSTVLCGDFFNGSLRRAATRNYILKNPETSPT